MCVVATREKERILVLKSQTLTVSFVTAYLLIKELNLTTPSYKIKKAKQEAKSTSTPSKEPAASDTLSPTLVDPAHVSVLGDVQVQGTVRSPDLSAQPAEKKKKVEDKKSLSKSVKSDKSTKSASSSRPATVSTDHIIDELDQKWSDRFNRLEALLMARTLD